LVVVFSLAAATATITMMTATATWREMVIVARCCVELRSAMSSRL
jgi:hypothetical protein